MPSKHGTRIKASRPKSRADKLRDRRNRLLAQSHIDLLEERKNRQKQFLDEGFEPHSSEDEEAEMVRINEGKRKKKKTAEEEADELFRDIRGMQSNEEEDEAEECRGAQREDAADEQSDETEMDDIDETEKDEEDMDAPPEEFSSSIKETFAEQLADNESPHNDDEGSNLVQMPKPKKLSKKKRDAQKRSTERNSENDNYHLEKGYAHLEFVPLDNISPDDEIPFVPGCHDERTRTVSFREQLLQISTAKKRSKRFRLPSDKRPKLA